MTQPPARLLLGAREAGIACGRGPALSQLPAGWQDCPVRVLIPLPDRDFDVTEVAVPWRILRDAGHQVVFAAEEAGTVPAADP
jgi:hypothetical protein